VHFELTAAKNGPKMPRPEGDAPSTRQTYGAGRLVWTRLSMDRLALLLSRLLKQPVFNQTGLKDAYDVDLTWQPDDVPADSDAALKPDIFTAVQQQLGLKLEVSKEPLEVLVVDRAEKTPAGN
jgi:uncharacterized protein (TIGR03435 family)